MMGGGLELPHGEGRRERCYGFTVELKNGENLSKEREATKWKALELETAIKTSKFVSHGQDYAKCQLLVKI